MGQRWQQLAIVTLGLVLTAGGCRGDGINRVVVTGNVRLNGDVVEDGQIRFIPQQGTPGPVAIQPIRGGKFAFQDSGGLPVRTYRVEILAWDPKVPLQLGPGVPARPQWAPAKYNKNSELSVTLKDSSGPIVHDFDLKK